MRLTIRIKPVKNAKLDRVLIPRLRPISTEIEAAVVIDQMILNLVLKAVELMFGLRRLSIVAIAPVPNPSEVHTPKVVQAIVVASIISQRGHSHFYPKLVQVHNASSWVCFVLSMLHRL